MREKIAIWGTGNSGKNLFYKLSFSGDIICWYDENHYGNYLYNCPIKKYSNKEINSKIVIAESNWNEICERLKKDGLRIIEDYIPSWVFNRKMLGWKNLLLLDKSDRNACLTYIRRTRRIAIVYGNCQTELIQRFLTESDEFISAYIIINIPRVCQEDDEIWDMIYESNIFSFCDLLIYQAVSDNNKFGITRSTSNLLKNMSKGCIKVSIPNIYFDGYFPQIQKNKYNVLEDVQEDGLFKWGDKYVDQLIISGLDKRQILDTIFDDTFLADKDIAESIDNAFDNLEKRELFNDIKISDYIRKYYKNRQLFFAPNHPNNELLIEMSKRILAYLGMSTIINDESVSSFMSLMGEDVVVYPSVIRYLGMEVYCKSFFPNRYIENVAYSATEYYQLYCDIFEKRFSEFNN